LREINDVYRRRMPHDRSVTSMASAFAFGALALIVLNTAQAKEV